MSELDVLPPAVRSCLRGYVARGRRLAMVRRAGLALTVLLIWTLLWCGADRLIQLPASVRLAALLTGTIAVLAMLAGPLRHWLGRETNWIAAAEEIERLDSRFDQRLVTVTSRLLGRPEHRGSDEIIEHLVYQVDREANDLRPAALLPLRSAAAPWLALLLTLAGVTGLCFVPGLGVRRLGARFALPWAALPPVTTATLDISPGDVDVPQSNPLQIDAQARHINGGQVWLSLSDDGKTWSRSAMTAANVGTGGDGHYSFTLPAVDRDLQYFVSGGDARGGPYVVRVLRHPAVSEFNIHYIYPAYTGKASVSVVNTDGIIEAPVGTEALVTITATEPLQLALFTAPGGEKALLARAGADNVRQGRIIVQRDGRYQLDLVSTRDVTGAGPPTTEIRAVPDRPPVVGLAEGGATYFLNPRDILPLTYQARDDYGIDSVTLRVQSGSAPTLELPVYPNAADADATQVDSMVSTSSPQAASASSPPAAPTSSQRPAAASRRISSQLDLDLASLSLTIGDVLTIAIVAKDTGGQSTSAMPLQVLAAPHSVFPEAYNRMADLDAARELAGSMTDELEAAIKAAQIPASGGLGNGLGGTSAVAEISRRNRCLSEAIESAAKARRAMLRAIAHGASPPLCLTLSAWVDAAQTIYSRMSGLLGSEDHADSAQPAVSLDRISQAVEVSRQIQSGLQTISQGERAAAILAAQDSIAAARGRVPRVDAKGTERLKQAIGRISQEIVVGSKEIGLDANASDLRAQLRAKVDAAASFAGLQHFVDFAAAARDWARQESSGGPRQHEGEPPTEFSERLIAAAEAEALRRDADLVRASDLELAAEAAAMLAAEPPAKIDAFAADLSALQQEHESRPPTGPATALEPLKDSSIREAGALARRQLATWADEPQGSATTRSNSPGTMPATVSRRTEKADFLAMLAGAHSACHRYADAAVIDRALLQAEEAMVAPSSAPSQRSDAQLAELARLEQTRLEIGQSMNAAEKLDGLADAQRQLAEETRRARDEAALADRQGELARQIAQLASAPATSSAALGIRGSLQPGSQDLNSRDRAIAAIVSAQARLSAMPRLLSDGLEAADVWRRAVKRDDEIGPSDGGGALDHNPHAAEASHKLESATAPLAPAVGEAIGMSLDPFAPEASASRAAITKVLVPAMKSLSESYYSEDLDAAGQSADGLRQAVEAVQRQLALARDEAAGRDPLVAAKWLARGAADALAGRSPDFALAAKYQELAAAALARAWDASIHRAAALRLAELPAMNALFAPGAGSNGANNRAGDSAMPMTGRDRPRLTQPGDSPLTAPHQTDPAGYEAALRAYFEALQGTRDKGQRTKDKGPMTSDQYKRPVASEQK